MPRSHLSYHKVTKAIIAGLLLICSAYIVSACQTTNSGSHQWNYNWKYQPKPSEVAQQPPHTLGQTIQTTSKDANAPFDALASKQQENGDISMSAGTMTDSAMAVPALPPVKVALLVPLTGQHAKLGQSMLNAAQMALFDTGHNNFQIIPEDTQATPQGAKQAAYSAVSKGADLVLGPVFSDSVRAAKPIISSRGINMIAFSTDWTLADRHTFIMGFLPFDQIERITSYAAANNIHNVGVIAPHTSYGNIVANSFSALAPKHGIEITEQQIFNPLSRNLTTDIRKFSYYDERNTQAEALVREGSVNAQGNQPSLDTALEQIPLPYDAVLMPVGGQQAITISNLMTRYGLPPTKVKRLGTGLLDDNGLAKEQGLAGTWFASPSPTLRRDFERKYKDIFGQDAPRLSTLAYDTTALAAVLARNGIEQNGQPAFDRRALLNPNGFFGIDGIFRFRPDGTAERGLAILEFRNGRLVIVDEAPITFEQQKEQIRRQSF